MELNPELYKFAQKLLSLDKQIEQEEQKPEAKKEFVHDPKRVVGVTDYKKFEHLEKEIETEDLKTNKKTQDMLKMGCNNDLRRERELYEKPAEEKLEAARIFKNEADEYLKAKMYKEAFAIYEKALLQLFYTFTEDVNMNDETDKLKVSLNLNLTICLINQEKLEDAIGYLQEVLRVDKNHIKAIYRTAYCYLKLDDTSKASEFVNRGIELQPESKEFLDLLKDIQKRESIREQNSKKFFSKALNKNN